MCKILFWCPIALFIMCQATFVFTSIAAIAQGHVSVPYISEGGTYSPESCIFGQLVNMACVLLVYILYVRYRQIEHVICNHVTDKAMDVRSTAKLNRIAVWMGIMSSLGLSVVANFQLTNVRYVHYVGAFICLGLGTIYFWLQGFITYTVHEYTGSVKMAQTRLVMAAFSSYYFFVTIFTNCDIFGVGVEGGISCKYRNVSVLSEWVVATTFCLYILSFSGEFRHVVIDQPKITVTSRKSYDTSGVYCIRV